MRTFPILFFYLLCNGCLTIIKPDSAWYPSYDLKLTQEDFKGTSITLVCAEGARDSPHYTIVRNAKACEDIRRNLEEFKLDVKTPHNGFPSTEENPSTLIVTLIDRGAQSDFGGWTLLPFIMTWSYFPLVVDFQLQMEIQIQDQSKKLIFASNIEGESTEFYGFYLLYLSFETPHQTDAKMRRAHELMSFVLNSIKTAQTKQLLAKRNL